MAVFANNDQDTLLRDLLAKHVAQLKAACTEHQIVLEKKAMGQHSGGHSRSEVFKASRTDVSMFEGLQCC